LSDCCSPKGYRWIFSERSARREAARYRKSGLDLTSRRIVELLMRHGVEGRTVLEVGGGIGAIQLELLKASAARAVSIELTPTYEEAAAELLREAGLESRVERRISDFAKTSGLEAQADIVVLNRVICCYPDMPLLAGVAADHTRQVLVLSYPRRNWFTRPAMLLANLALRLSRREFHIFLHPPRGIAATTQAHGLRPISSWSGLVWTVAAFERATAT
jgi:16S rRNA G966 N2-methylase RsmD